MLTGRLPPEGMRSVTATSPPLVLSAEMVSSPALTTKSSRPSRAMPPWDASDAPVPRPPVGTDPTASSEPSAYRS